jgi:hypothetical protein
VPAKPNCSQRQQRSPTERAGPRLRYRDLSDPTGLRVSYTQSRTWRSPPGRDHAGNAQHDQRERYRTPPVLPEGPKTMAALAPGPEDAKEEDHSTDNLACSTHGLRLSLSKPNGALAPSSDQVVRTDTQLDEATAQEPGAPRRTTTAAQRPARPAHPA